MTQVVVDRLLRGQLPDLTERLEFVDESGELLGYFTPAESLAERLNNDDLRKLAVANPPPTEWFTTEEECPFQ